MALFKIQSETNKSTPVCVRIYSQGQARGYGHITHFLLLPIEGHHFPIATAPAAPWLDRWLDQLQMVTNIPNTQLQLFKSEMLALLGSHDSNGVICPYIQAYPCYSRYSSG